MAEIEIKGTRRYINYLSKHLRKEHPSTKKRMKVEKEGKKMRYKRKVNKKKVSINSKLKKIWTIYTRNNSNVWRVKKAPSFIRGMTYAQAKRKAERYNKAIPRKYRR